MHRSKQRGTTSASGVGRDSRNNSIAKTIREAGRNWCEYRLPAFTNTALTRRSLPFACHILPTETPAIEAGDFCGI